MTNLIWHTEQRCINDLIPFEHNPREISEYQVKSLTPVSAKLIVIVNLLNT